MEPVTHVLTGACLARTGLNRRAAYATLAMAVAAEFPDIDTLWGLRGPVAGFQHHRGITHTFLGVPVESAVIVVAVWLLHRWRGRHRRTTVPEPTASTIKPLTAAPVRWWLLYVFTLLALLSHLFLDFTNNYGLRPFFPFNPRWYAASITFIFDPIMLGFLLAALALPPFFRLINAEVGGRRQPFAARGWSIAALLCVGWLWGWRAVEHERAEEMALLQTYSQPVSVTDHPVHDSDQPLPAEPSPHLLRPQRVSVNPDPIDSFRWYIATDFGPLYQLGTVDLLAGTYIPAQSAEPKPVSTAMIEAAERSPLGRAYLDWSPMPLIRAERRNQGDAAGSTGTTVVTFRDPRFLGESPWLHVARTCAPLTGTVVLSPQGAVMSQSMDGKAQR